MKAIDHLVRLLDEILPSAAPLGFNELHRRSGISRPVLARLLRSCCQAGLLRCGAAGYEVGPTALRFGRTMVDRNVADPIRLGLQARPFVEELCRNTGQSCMAVRFDVDDMQSVCRVTAPDALGLMPEGNRMRFYGDHPWGWIGALGQPDLLAALRQRCELLLDWSGRRLPMRLRSEYRRLRQSGWLLQADERRHRLAAPLLDDADRLVGALVLGGTPATLPAAIIPGHGQLLATTAGNCSRRLGWSGGLWPVPAFSLSHSAQGNHDS